MLAARLPARHLKLRMWDRFQALTIVFAPAPLYCARKAYTALPQPQPARALGIDDSVYGVWVSARTANEPLLLYPSIFCIKIQDGCTSTSYQLSATATVMLDEAVGVAVEQIRGIRWRRRGDVSVSTAASSISTWREGPRGHDGCMERGGAEVMLRRVGRHAGEETVCPMGGADRRRGDE